MSSIINYITSNELPCKAFLDARKSTNIDTSGGVFTLINLLGDTNYDFIQSNSLLYPSVVSEGISFSDTERLYSRNGDLFNNAVSYTLINLVSGSSYDNNQLLHASKITSTLPPALEYAYLSSNIEQQHSRLNLYNFITQDVTYIDTVIDDIPYDLQTLNVSHNLKYGKTTVNVNQTGYVSYINKDKGKFDSDVIDNVYLGNSNTQTKPFSNVLKCFLLFIPEISQVHIDALVTKLLITQITWEDITTSDWESIDSDMWDDIINDV